MAKKFNQINGRVWYPILIGEGNYGYYGNSEIKEVEHPLPYEENVLAFNGTRTGAELALGKFKIEEEKSPFMENSFLKMYEDFLDCKKISYNVSTDTLEVDDELAALVFNTENYTAHNEWFEKVANFVYYVMMHRNPFVYTMFSEFTLKTKRFANNINNRNRWYAVINIWKNIDSLNNFEKIAKSIGEEFIYDNIINVDFSLNNAKKLHQVVEMPLVVAQGIKKLGLEEYFNEVKTIAAIDKNYAITLLDFIFDFKKAFTGTKYSCKSDVGTFIKNVSKLMETGIYNKNFNDLLGFLMNESLNYSSFYLPYREAGELVDYLSVAQEMKAANDDVKFERFPRNIQKAHNVMNQNSSILKTPRPEEFAAAIAKQAFLNDDKDENYIFMVPRNEMDLMNEGNTLHHCVASYRDRIIDKGTKVVFMRKKDDVETPFVTIEYEGGLAVQVREMYNADVTDPDVLAAVNRWLPRAERRERKH